MLMCLFFLVNRHFVWISVFFFSFLIATLSKQKNKQGQGYAECFVVSGMCRLKIQKTKAEQSAFGTSTPLAPHS